MNEARDLLRLTQMAVLSSEARMLNQEMVSLPVTAELLGRQSEEAAARLEQARQRQQRLEERVNRQRQDEASQRVGRPELVAQMNGNQPVLQQVAQENAAYSERLLEIAAAVQANHC